MKKITLLFCILFISISITACNKSNDPTMLGTSGFSIILPEGFSNTDDDFDEDQIAYYYKDDESIDFDVYQWAKEGQYNLKEEADYFAAEYGTTASEVIINNIPGMKYITSEKYDGYEYTVINYMFDDGDNIVELCFWTINTPDEISAVDEIINTLTTNENYKLK